MSVEILPAWLDIFPKTLQEFRHRTQTGAIVSICCAILIGTLTLVELGDFVTVKDALAQTRYRD